MKINIYKIFNPILATLVLLVSYLCFLVSLQQSAELLLDKRLEASKRQKIEQLCLLNSTDSKAQLTHSATLPLKHIYENLIHRIRGTLTAHGVKKLETLNIPLSANCNLYVSKRGKLIYQSGNSYTSPSPANWPSQFFKGLYQGSPFFEKSAASFYPRPIPYPSFMEMRNQWQNMWSQGKNYAWYFFRQKQYLIFIIVNLEQIDYAKLQSTLKLSLQPDKTISETKAVIKIFDSLCLKIYEQAWFFAAIFLLIIALANYMQNRSYLNFFWYLSFLIVAELVLISLNHHLFDEQFRNLEEAKLQAITKKHKKLRFRYEGQLMKLSQQLSLYFNQPAIHNKPSLPKSCYLSISTNKGFIQKIPKSMPVAISAMLAQYSPQIMACNKNSKVTNFKTILPAFLDSKDPTSSWYFAKPTKLADAISNNTSGKFFPINISHEKYYCLYLHQGHGHTFKQMIVLIVINAHFQDWLFRQMLENDIDTPKLIVYKSDNTQIIGNGKNWWWSERVHIKNKLISRTNTPVPLKIYDRQSIGFNIPSPIGNANLLYFENANSIYDNHNNPTRIIINFQWWLLLLAIPGFYLLNASKKQL